jgi:hypothetical protein
LLFLLLQWWTHDEQGQRWCRQEQWSSRNIFLACDSNWIGRNSFLKKDMR